jgi:hypothetical protein
MHTAMKQTSANSSTPTTLPWMNNGPVFILEFSLLRTRDTWNVIILQYPNGGQRGARGGRTEHGQSGVRMLATLTRIRAFDHNNAEGKATTLLKHSSITTKHTVTCMFHGVGDHFHSPGHGLLHG